ncbi:MAG: cytochrome c biogenesis protein CcsA [Bacteroidia bacterium]
MDFFTGGNTGEWFTALAFGSAFVALWSFLMAERETDLEKQSWERLGVAGFATHILSILGIIGTLFYLIYTHKYEYHYVWSHSSNELPVYYMISCFWEGQEGSFLLWCFWHSILGGMLLFNKGPWRNLVIAVIASIELILSSMLLGVYINASWISGIFLLMVLLPAVYMGMQYFNRRNELPMNGIFHLASGFMAAGFAILLFRGQLGAGANYILLGLPNSLDSTVFFLFGKFVLAYAIGYLIYLYQISKTDQVPIIEILSGAVLIGIVMVGMGTEPGLWKLGSSPFTLLKSVFPDEAVYTQNPDFIPSNGNGLNPLLQNYWMVIHPPTLFLGFAATVVPFAFVIAGLIKGQYHQWIKPALPWMAFSVMILGVGIIMGGYWAYETLNFGGYWNWDPVENSSLVPWLCGVASLHAMLIYRKTKAYLKLTMLMIIGTFLLVLYSTFLTRSGILGETSVHTFTDLGLSGQLLVLVLSYVGLVFVLMLFRWNKIPQRADESSVWSAEFMLFTGTLVFLFSSLVIAFSTSLPVFNNLFGSNLAPPADIQEFYYTWNVWFAILFGILSGLGQFLWWRISRKKSVSEALFIPFLLTMISGSGIIIALALNGMDFAYDKEFAEMISASQLDQLGSIGKLFAYLKYGILTVADELLLFSALFAIFPIVMY